MFSNNKTSNWIKSKSAKEKSILFEEARMNVPQHRQRYKEHLQMLEKERLEKQMLREREREMARKKLIAMKEKITSDLTEYGLWITTHQVHSHLSASHLIIRPS